MKLGGFALKKGRKKPLGASAGFSAAAPTAPQAPEKVFVTDFDPSAPAELPQSGQPPLVIPLRETNAWNEDTQKVKDTQNVTHFDPKSETAEEAAARQLVQEATATEESGARDGTLVIPSTHREKKRAELFQDGYNRQGGPKKVPILQQNAVPGLDELQDVVDKYRHDVALRPDAPDVTSDVYESVPVATFGAALLRGMGWTGSVDPDDVGDAPQPRHKLLGLGATKRSTLPGEDKKKKRKKHKKEDQKQDQKQEQDSDRRSGLNERDSRNDRREDRDDKDGRCRDDSRDRRKRSRSRDRDRDRNGDRGRSERDRDRERDRGGRNGDCERDSERERDRCSRSDRRSRSRSRSSDRRSRRR